ncbi:fumarylacetoacetate hydrolase family protein [Streptomyces sp. NBC_01142]|uniref:fumarylacetoacetate hydrolase family protein n=1 Tax=Streptomyces sp. NBC_01142 TaxID=2975865 RepID=UPI002256B8C1|nr:fumarylacetoacetate hydrolase family protein [Streptomyces sp. NBC_01142]MCX4824771.1 fumarylacetoacetate hydrolase family protein [Streptomyces sp. NBC_01142]MCX4827007.1 fumarylacetoacetate hydrolase family protein [Streptomyces sp. NBC_01142]MCX4827055.1 fumarylacetoacetate hydrolase family protein [Streptomyces sp. NBC_01142]
MRLARFNTEDGHQILASHRGGWISLSGIEGYKAPHRLADLLDASRRSELAGLLESRPDAEPADVRLEEAATIIDAGDIWGAGLNYKGHSQDLSAQQPSSGPGSYLRPANCLIGNGGVIELPSQSKRVTAEAELGLVVGTECKNVRRDEWRSVIAGVTAVLDMTAEDVIRENPRYIPWAKGFDTFCSVGPQLVTLDEFEDADLQSIRVSTVRNGEVVASAQVSDMKYDLGYLVEYFTAGRTLVPGTVICTGTPGAAVINSGDSITSVVEGIGTLSHSVKG